MVTPSFSSQVPDGDNRSRLVCDTCGFINYANPKIVVGSVAVWGERILLCRRAIEPRHGYWTLPAGFMELGETTAQGAARETQEEAGARIDMGPLFAVLDIPHVDQVHIFYLARLTDVEFEPGPESLEARLFDEDEIPWDDLAFRSVSTALKLFFADRARGSFQIHSDTLLRGPEPVSAVAAPAP